MKNNLVQQLDLLEAQLAKCTDSNTEETTTKLASTKYLLERLEKTGELKSDPKQLRDEISFVKREIVLRKLHFANSTVKRFLKQFKKVEPMRIAKRVKVVDCESKKSMLEREISELKESNIEQWAEEIVKRALSKQFDVEAVTGQSFIKRNLNTAEINLFSRIGKTDAVKAALNQLLEGCSIYFEAKEPGSIGLHSLKDSVSISSPTAKPHNNSEAKEKKRKIKELYEAEDESYENNMHSTSDKEEERLDAFFEQPVSTSRNDDTSDEEQEEGITREGLPALAEWYISPSEDEEVLPDPVAQPTKKNRRGQRARRKIWEQKFGQRANHVLKQQREEESEKREKELKKRRKADRELAAKKQKIEFASRPLHPSWEARQNQKKSTEHVKFEGKKMKFD